MKNAGFFFLTILLLISCGGPDNATEKQSGGLVAIEVQEILRISDDIADDFLFGRLAGIYADADGEILIGDQSEKSIYQFSDDGIYIGKFGKEGAGPGEFGQYFNLSMTSDDTLFVMDMMQSRIVTFGKNRSGEWHFGQTIPLIRGEGGFPTQIYKLSDGNLMIHYNVAFTQSAESGAKPYLQVTDREGNRIGEKILEIEPYQMHIIRSADRVMGIGIPHSHSQPFAISSDDHIYTGFNETFLISKYDRDGNHLLDIEYPVEPVMLTREDKDKATESFDDAAAEVRSQIPDYRPAFTRLLVSDAGDLWVNRGNYDEISLWYVFSNAGEPLYEVRLPERYFVNQIRHGNIYGTERDEDELQSVVVYRYISGGRVEGVADNM